MKLLTLSFVLFLIHLAAADLSFRFEQDAQNEPAAAALDLIRLRKYNEAITKLDRILEREPRNGEALTYLVTANLYLERDFTKAKEDFDKAYTFGGGATFFVTHSHENVLAGDDFVDYCRGWLHLRRTGITFVPTEGDHGFKLAFADVAEFKPNRFGKTLFHIKSAGKTQNFRGFTSTELERLLIIACFKSFQSR
jgi:tetratricopeptide (TPR) repeat protein